MAIVEVNNTTGFFGLSERSIVSLGRVPIISKLNGNLGFGAKSVLSSSPFIQSIVALSNRTIQVNFSKPYDRDQNVQNPNSYNFGPIDIFSVDLPSDSSRYVVLNTSEMLNSVTYFTTISGLKFDGVVQQSLTSFFTGAGLPPNIVSAQSLSINTVFVAFDEALRNTISLTDATNYSIPGLTVINAEFGNFGVILTTSQQLENSVYEVTVNTEVLDFAGNSAPSGQTVEFLGYVDKPVERLIPFSSVLSMDKFVVDQDLQSNRFVHKFFSGIDRVWEKTLEKKEGLKSFYDPYANTKDLLLELSYNFGWPESFISSLSKLDTNALRRLYVHTPEATRFAGTESTVKGVINAITGKDGDIRNWQQIKPVLGDETNRVYSIPTIYPPGSYITPNPSIFVPPVVNYSYENPSDYPNINNVTTLVDNSSNNLDVAGLDFTIDTTDSMNGNGVLAFSSTGTPKPKIQPPANIAELHFLFRHNRASISDLILTAKDNGSVNDTLFVQITSGSSIRITGGSGFVMDVSQSAQWFRNNYTYVMFDLLNGEYKVRIYSGTSFVREQSVTGSIVETGFNEVELASGSSVANFAGVCVSTRTLTTSERQKTLDWLVGI